MKRLHLAALFASFLLGGSAAAVRIAGAQSSPDLAPSGMVCSGQAAGAGFLVQTAEPPQGFDGACLGGAMTYQPTLPTVCYSPGPGALYWPPQGPTTCTIAASKVALPYSELPPGYDSYRVLMTCYSHAKGSSCPSGSFAVSRSCCDLGTRMISLDGKTASGLVNFAL